MGLAHYNASGNKLITQDLNFVDDQEIKKGDTVEIAYTGWLHAGNSFGKVCSENFSIIFINLKCVFFVT